jgi:molybdopterin synthase catalytic subunit
VELLARSAIDLPRLVAAVSHEGCGGTAVFVGTVRRSVEDGPVVCIEYSAYEPMAGLEFDRIVAEACERWPGARIAGQHRIGRVPVGETSIAVAVATPHRAEAFAACRYVVEQTKQRLPVWKQEVFTDGSRAWRGNTPVEADAGTDAE